MIYKGQIGLYNVTFTAPKAGTEAKKFGEGAMCLVRAPWGNILATMERIF